MSLLIKNYNTINIHDYIDAIENEIHKSKEGKVFKVKPRYQDKKTMIRTLLNIQHTSEFHQLYRRVQKQGAYDKMNYFCYVRLKPLMDERLSYDVKQNKIPNFDKALDIALNTSPEKGALVFHRLASNRYYKGNLMDLVLDLVPELEKECIDAMKELTEDEILINIIHHIATDKSDFDKKEIRIKAAINCVECLVKPKMDKDSSSKSQIFGKKCENDCIEWLKHQKRERNQSILSNVLVNDIKSRSKLMNKMKNTSKNIVWTQAVGVGMTSEFDAIIIKHVTNVKKKDNVDDTISTFITEIWEAKNSCNPNTILDILNKKVTTFCLLRKDPTLLISSGSDFFEVAQTNHQKIVFGMFCSEISSPSDAVGKMKAAVISNVLSTNFELAINAVENGIFEINAEVLLHNLNDIRKKYVDTCEEFDFVLKVPT